MFGLALVVDFAVFMTIVSAGVYLAANIRDGASLLKTVTLFAGLGMSAPALLAAAGWVGLFS